MGLNISNIHEYVIFDRVRVDPILAMRWPEFDETYPGWSQWDSSRDFLVEWAIMEEHIERVDEILAHKTLRATLPLCGGPFCFLHSILNEKDLHECDVDIEKGDYDYADDIVSCAGAGFIRGDLSLASLTAVYDLHAVRVDLFAILPADVANAVLNQPERHPMFPRMPHMTSDLAECGVDGIGVVQARRVIEFLLRAWREQWPLHGVDQAPRNGESIRSCVVAEKMAKALRKRTLAKPCMFRWYES
jgi:hypothetical protein